MHSLNVGKKMNSLTKTLLLLALSIVSGCNGVNKQFEGKATISDDPHYYTIVAVDGKDPERAQHHGLHTVAPNVLVTPGSHEFTILYSTKEGNPILTDLERKEITIEATVKEGYYFIENHKGSITLKQPQNR